MQYDIFTFGVPMVELVRAELDSSLCEPGIFKGPFPAGDPGIFVNTAVKLGCHGGYAGVIGTDDFGKCFFECMKRNHVETSCIRADAQHATGMSLVANFSDGSRKFLFAMSSSAAAQLGLQDFAPELLKKIKWIHVSGFALSVSESIAELHRKIMQEIGNEVIVSFDPNYRSDIIKKGEFLKRCESVFERCNVFLPSWGEASLFCEGVGDEEISCRIIAETGKKVILKNGRKGAMGFEDERKCFVPAFEAAEVDSTGAGDIFGGTLAASLLSGKELSDAIQYACAAGALAVERVGFMDIAPTWAELEEVIASRSRV